VLAFSSVGNMGEDLLVCVSSGRERVGLATAVADLAGPPAIVCTRGMERRFGVDMVFCAEVLLLVLALKSGVVEDG